MSKKDDDGDEKVDGPRIAAQIIMRMPPEKQQRIVEAMKEKAPALAAVVQKSIPKFEDLAELTTGSIQALLKEVAQDDVVRALRAASPAVMKAIYSSVSERRQKMLVEASEAMQNIPQADIDESQRRILIKLEELRSQGKIRSETTHDTWV